jgi:hypothetical protein
MAQGTSATLRYHRWRRSRETVAQEEAVGGEEVAAWEPKVLGWLAHWQPRPPVPGLTRVAAYVWASPITLIGLIIGAAAAVRPKLCEGVLLFPNAGGITGWVIRRRNFAAGAFGHVIVCIEDPSPSLLAHELLHTRQAERFGPLMAPVYLCLLAIYGYWRHPMERAAREAASHVLRT